MEVEVQPHCVYEELAVRKLIYENIKYPAQAETVK
jgi:hypothetical protein